MKPALILSLSCLLLLSGCMDDGKSSAAQIKLQPVLVPEPVHRNAGMQEGEDLSRVAFRIETDWTTGPIELRFPEVLRSSMGYHFLDNYAAELTPISEWDVFPK